MKNFIKICVLLASFAGAFTAHGRGPDGSRTQFNVWTMEALNAILATTKDNTVNSAGTTSWGGTGAIFWLDDGDDILLRGSFPLENSIVLKKKISLGSSQGSWTLSRGAAGYNITIASGGALTLLADTTLDGRDQSGGNLVGTDSFIVISSGGALTLEAGTIQNCRRDADGVAVRVNGGTFTMNGGTVQNCRTTNGSSGGAVLVASGTMTMNGGTITGCRAGHEGAAIAVGAWATSNVGRLYLRGGTISGNRSYTYSGDNYSSFGGAVTMLNNESYIYVSGSPVVSGNTLISGTGAPRDITFLDPAWRVRFVQDGPLTADARLGVYYPTAGTTAADAVGEPFGIAEGTTGGESAFFWDGNASAVNAVRSANILYWEAKDPVCRLASNGVGYASLADAYAAAANGDTIQLLRDLSIDYSRPLALNKSLTLTSAPGATYTLSRGTAGAALAVPAGKSLTLTGITLDGAGLAGTSAMVVVQDGGTLALQTGTTIRNCVNAQGTGGAVHLDGSSARLNVSGLVTVTENQGADGERSNVQPTGVGQIRLVGPLTGSVGVDYPGLETAVGAPFGVAGGTGAENFSFDKRPELFGSVKSGQLVWKSPNPVYDGSKPFSEILAEAGASDGPLVIEIPNSTASADVLVIPAGRDVVIDLMGNTLTADIVADGRVTITDSTPYRTGRLVGTLTQGEAGALVLECGTYTVRPDDAWLADGRIVLENADDTFLVTRSIGSSAVAGCTLDTRRGVRLVNNPYVDVLPITYSAKDWVYGASKASDATSTVTLADALPAVDGDFANAQWHDGMDAADAAPGDDSYDYPSGNLGIREVGPRNTLRNGPGEDEVEWRETRSGLVQAVIRTDTGTLRAWYKFPETRLDIIPVLPGDPAKVKEPGTDGTEMNKPGNPDYPGYTTTNDPSHPWDVVEDPFNPGNYVAETPLVADPANTQMQVVLQVVGPGTLTWKDLVLDGSGENDSTMTVSIDGGDPVTVHTGGMDGWADQKVVYGGDVDTVHTVVITFKGNSSGNTADQARGYVDGVVWAPYVPATKDDVKAADSEDFTFANLGSEPTAEKKGETDFYPNGATAQTTLDTTSTVDGNGRQLTSTVGGATDASTGTEDYWYAVKDPGKDDVAGNTIAQTSPTLSPGESTTLTVTDLTGPVKVSWDMLLEDPSAAQDARLEVVVTKHVRDAQGNPVLDPVTGEPKTTTTVHAYTAAEIAAWTHGYLPLGGPSDYRGNGVYESAATYDVSFTFVNNSEGTGVGKLDNIKIVHPDINVAPVLNDGANSAAQGSKYPGEVNDPSDPHHPDYTVRNDRDNPWEVVEDPKKGTDGANDPSNPNDTVAQTPDSLKPGEETTLTFTVTGDGEFRWSDLIDPGTPEAEGRTPAKITVIVDGVENEILTSDPSWTDHVLHVTDAEGGDGATHTIEIVFTNDGDTGDATAFIDNVSWTPAATQPQMQQIVRTDPPTTAEETQKQIAVANDPESGWMPYWGVDAHGNPVIEGVRSPDGTEGLTDEDGLDSTFTVGVVGSGELKVGTIVIPSTSEDPSENPDGGLLTITVDSVAFTIPPDPSDAVETVDPDTGVTTIVVTGYAVQDPEDPDKKYVVSYTETIDPATGVITLTDFTVQVIGEPDTPHTFVFEYTRDAFDPAGNTAAIVKDIAWMTYGERAEGGSSWLQGKALWIIDHEDPGDGWVYLAFEPELKVAEEIGAWVDRSVRNRMIKVKFGATREAADACEPVVAELSEAHEVSSSKVWIKVSHQALTDRNGDPVAEPVGFWRIYIDGPAIQLSGTSGAARVPAASAGLQDTPPIVGEGAVSVNTFGILKIASATKNTLIAVPWTWYSKEEGKARDIPVRKLVKTTNLEEDDILLAWCENGTYAAWSIDEYGDWAPLETVRVTESATDVAQSGLQIADPKKAGGVMTITWDKEKDLERQISIPRGNGLWLCRQNPLDEQGNPKPFWIYGQSVDSQVLTDIPAPTGGETVRSTILGNPYAQVTSINDLEFEGEIEANDHIWVPNGTTTPYFLFRKSTTAGMKWCYSYFDTVTRKTKYVTKIEVKPGLGFWYDRRGKTPLKVRWPKAPVSSVQ